MQMSIADIFYILVKWRKFIILNFLIFVIISICVAFLLPVKFTSTGTILPPSEDADSGLGFLSLISDLPISLPSLPMISRPGDLHLAILRSRTVNEAVINKLNLKDHFGIKVMTNALLRLSGKTNFDITEESVLIIQATDENPKLAQQIVITFLEELDRVNQQVKRTSAKNTREFLEKRLSETESQLNLAANNIREFQAANKVLSIEEQLRTAIEMAANLRGQLAIKEVELHLAERKMESSHPTILQIRSHIRELENQLDKIEKGTGIDSSSFMIPFSKVPDLGMQYAFLTKDLEVYKAIYTLLYQQVEQARIQEKKDTPTLRILDYPNLPDKKSKPQRRLIVLLAAMLSALVSFFLIFFVEYLNKLKETDNQKYNKIIESWQQITPSFLSKSQSK